jgi:flagellar biosynthetic protein FlhB
MADDRQEKPTPRRIQKARKEGRFITSRLLPGSVQFAAGVYLLARQGPEWFGQFARHAEKRLAWALSGTADLTPASVGILMRETIWLDLLPMWRTGLILAGAAFATQMLVTQFGFATGNLEPKLERLNPLGRLKSLPSENFGQLLQAALLLPLVALLLVVLIREQTAQLLPMARAALPAGIAAVGRAAGGLLEKGAWAVLVIGLIDYARQANKYWDSLKMTKQEIKDEMKESEGNPETKQRIRRLQREYARRRMMADVEKATAVIVNPTHYAVALRYDLAAMAAPKVVAKGRDLLAQRIRERAREHNVPIVENPPLARALYQAARVGEEIPAHLYRAVAEVLAYIHRLMRGGR